MRVRCVVTFKTKDGVEVDFDAQIARTIMKQWQQNALKVAHGIIAESLDMGTAFVTDYRIEMVESAH